MLNRSIHPSTINGIKRHARQIKSETSVPHHEALNIAARSAGYENFQHACNQLRRSNTPNCNHLLFLTVYWSDREDYTSGREVLEVQLSKPLLEIATRNELKEARGLRPFRVATPDHLVRDQISESQIVARDRICEAVRVLKFIEATGLKPNLDNDSAFPNRDYNNELPKADHSSVWFDTDTGQSILIDEPYLEPIVDGERALWAKKHNWHLKASKWAGMYYPDHSHMFVATDASSNYDFDSLMAKIDSLPPPVTQERWEGISSPGHDTFFSPLTLTPQDRKRAVAKGTIHRLSSRKTVPMRSWDAPNNERRPNAVMSTEGHLTAARLIKAIVQSVATPTPVCSRLSVIRSKLENWFFSEHSSEVTNKFDLLYYGGIESNDPYVSRSRSTKGVISLLQELRELLKDSYVDCEPLRRMIGKLDTSIKLTSKKSLQQ